MPMQHISQHCWAQANMLRAFGHSVVTCCVVGSSLKMVKFEPTTPNMSQPCNTVAKHAQHVAPNNVAIYVQCMLRWHVAIV